MFVYHHGSTTMILLLYVDDIILTGSSSYVLHNFISVLSHQFAMKDLGDLYYFWGVQVARNSQGIFLSQQKYIHDLIRKFHMHAAKPVRTLSLSRTSLTLTNEKLLADPTEYRSMVGALQYVTMTRPDIAYVVHVVSQYMHAPRTTYLHAVKHIFRYLQGTLSFGLQLRSSSTPSVIVAYLNANWVSCKDSCRSMTGYAVFFDPNLIS